MHNIPQHDAASVKFLRKIQPKRKYHPAATVTKVLRIVAYIY